MPGAVVADAGPLMALAKLNLLHLLKQLYVSPALCRRLSQKVLG